MECVWRLASKITAVSQKSLPPVRRGRFIILCPIRRHESYVGRTWANLHTCPIDPMMNARLRRVTLCTRATKQRKIPTKFIIIRYRSRRSRRIKSRIRSRRFACVRIRIRIRKFAQNRKFAGGNGEFKSLHWDLSIAKVANLEAPSTFSFLNPSRSTVSCHSDLGLYRDRQRKVSPLIL